MKLGMNQPYFFPYIGFYQLVNAVDTFIVYDNLNYIRYGWVNRNRYLVFKGEPTYFSADIERVSSLKKIREIKLSANRSWRRKLLNGFFLNYKKSPYFSEIYDLLEKIVLRETNGLSELCAKSIIEISKFLGVKTNFIENPNYESLEESLECENLVEAFPEIKLKVSVKKVFRIIKVCQM